MVSPAHRLGLLRTPRFPTVTAAFFHHVEARPNAVAARDLSPETPAEVTYSELARRSCLLASRLRALGVGPGVRVPLVVKRGIDMLVGIVAVLSCGAQYVPLDGGVVPDATLRFVLGQTGGSVALALQSTSHRLAKTSTSTILIIDALDYDDVHSQPQTPFQDLSQPDHGCYVVYTSGK